MKCPQGGQSAGWSRGLKFEEGRACQSSSAGCLPPCRGRCVDGPRTPRRLLRVQGVLEIMRKGVSVTDRLGAACSACERPACRGSWGRDLWPSGLRGGRLLGLLDFWWSVRRSEGGAGASVFPNRRPKKVGNQPFFSRSSRGAPSFMRGCHVLKVRRWNQSCAGFDSGFPWLPEREAPRVGAAGGSGVQTLWGGRAAHHAAFPTGEC